MFKVTPIETELAQRIRATMIDDFGNKLTVLSEEEGSPCRHCLKRSRPGEALILFAHRPFAKLTPYAEVGPIFVHAEECPRYESCDEFPPEFKAGRTLTIRAYAEGESIVDGRLAAESEVDSTIHDFLSDPSVAFVHARSSAYGCFLCRIDRA